MKYFSYFTTKHLNSDLEHEKRVLYYMPETANKGVGNGGQICIPPDPDNVDYAKLLEEVAAGTSTIEEIADTPCPASPP